MNKERKSNTAFTFRLDQLLFIVIVRRAVDDVHACVVVIIIINLNNKNFFSHFPAFLFSTFHVLQ